MQLDALMAFREVFERRSFSAAARALGLDPSVVSRRVKSLEQELDVVLFYRSTRSVTPTASAESFYREVDPALRSIEEAALSVRTQHVELSGLVRVSAPTALGRAKINPVIHQLCRDYPELRVEVLLSDRHIDLFEEGIDIAIRPADPGSGSLVVRKIGLSEQWLVAAPDYLSARPPITLNPASFAGHRVVLRIVRGAPIDIRDRLPPAVRAEVGVGFLCDDIEAVAEAAVAGLGLALVPKWLVAPWVTTGALQRVNLGMPQITAPVFAVLPAGRRTTARTRALLDALIAGWDG